MVVDNSETERCLMTKTMTPSGINYMALNLTVKNQRRSGSMVTNESGIWKHTIDKYRRWSRNINRCPHVELWHTPEAKVVSCKPSKERSGVGPYKRRLTCPVGVLLAPDE